MLPKYRLSALFQIVLKRISYLFLLFCSLSYAQISYVPAFPEIGFDFPVEIQSPNDGTNRLFVVEQAGVIKVFPNKSDVVASEVTTFLDISQQVDFSLGQEIGLLGLAFHPNFTTNGFFYVYFTDRDATGKINMVLNRYSVSNNPNKADLESGETIFRFQKNQDNSNHNGGKIAFGPDGYLYISIGDGGGAGDPAKNGQNLSTVFGSILRIDVDVDGNNPLETNPELPSGKYEIPADNPLMNAEGLNELYAWGIRNTWKFSFDGSGQLWAADVGQNTYEEINLITNGGNYGWNKFEAESQPSYGIDTELATIPDTKPIFYYDHASGDVSITGGYVYEGPISNPLMANKYIFGDYVSGRVWSLDYDSITSDASVELLFRTDGQFISSFGKDTEGNLYFTDYGFGAKMYQIIDLDDDGGDEPIAEIFEGTWSELENGVEGTVETIAVDSQGNYYVGGEFTSAGGILANNLAKYSAETGWDNVGGGTNGRVNSIAIDGNDGIYIGGNFTSAGGVSTNYVAYWNDNQWSNMSGGTNGEVLKINMDSDDRVYVGGTFISAGGIGVNNIALFFDGQWSALTDTDTGVAGTNNEVREIAIDNGLVFVGGNFDSAGSKLASRIAQWDGSRWSTLGLGTSGFVQAIETTDDFIYAGGNFSVAGNQQVNRIARWNKADSQWEALDEGMGGNVNSIIAYSGGIFIGGNFLSASEYPVNNIAYWSPNEGWFALGSTESNGVDNTVRTLLKKPNGTGILVGGAFVNASNIQARHLASFDFENLAVSVSCPENIIEDVPSDSCERTINLIEPTVFGVPSDQVVISGSRSDGKELNESFLLGQTLITWEITVDGSPLDNCVQLVELVDNTDPVAVCKNIELELDESGEVRLVPFDLDNGSSDNCEITSYEIVPSTFTIDDIGINEVVFTVSDGAGNSSSCTALVTITEQDVSLGCNPLNLPWQGEDIGDVGATGSSCYDVGLGRFEIEASGADIWETADEFHYVYQELQGDVEIIARVTDLVETHPWAKAGVMMRNSNDPSSEFVLMSMSPNPNSLGISYTLQDRPQFAQEPTPRDNNLGPVPVGNYGYYMRLVREGDTFSGFASNEIGNWELLGSKEINMDETILVGLAVTSHSDGIFTTAVFDDVTIFSEIVDDFEPPIIDCPDTIITSNDSGNCDALVTLEPPTAIDNVSAAEDLTFEGIRSDGAELDDPFLVGETTIIWVAIDEAGNASLSCDQLIVVADNELPVVVCQDITIEVEEDSIINLVPNDIDAGSTDNCSIATRTVLPNTFTFEDLGENMVEFSVEDVHGNIATCQALVTVISSQTEDCAPILPNEDLDLILSDGAGFMGIDEVYGTSEITNNSDCALVIENKDAGQPFANYRIPIDLGANGINAGDELFISLDGNSDEGVARIEVLVDNTPNNAVLFESFADSGWSTISDIIIVPEDISSLDIWLYSNYLSISPGLAVYDNLVVSKVNPVVDCPDELPNEEPSITLSGEGGFQGLDSFSGNDSITNASSCSLMISNNDAGQPFSNYRIPIVLADHGISAGDNLLISLDGNGSQGVARIEVNQDNRPNSSLASYTYSDDWSTFSKIITVPDDITSLNIWLYSNYLVFDSGGTAYYDNLRVTNLGLGLFSEKDSTKANSVNDVRLFPNPSREVVHVIPDESSDIQDIQVFDQLGRLVKTVEVAYKSRECAIPVSDLPVGTYIIKTMDSKGRILDKQMIIER